MPRPLTPQQQRQLKKATAGGHEQQFLQNHVGVAKHLMRSGQGGPKQGGAPGSTAGPSPAAAPAGGPPKTPGAGSTPPAGGGGQKPPGAAGSTAPAPPAAAPPSFTDWLTKQFGSGNPFGPPAGGGAGGAMASGAGGALGDLATTATQGQWYGGDPIATASAAANRNLQSNLGDIRARFGAQGGGRSSREAIMEGTAVGDVNTNLGANLASQGIGARAGNLSLASNALAQKGNLGLGLGGLENANANTALNATLGAGALNNASAAALANTGAATTGIGAGEQNIPGIGALLSLLTAMSSTFGTGGSSQKGSQGYYTK